MTTKKELEAMVKDLSEKLEKQEIRPGISVSNCNFDMGTDNTKIAIAEAVKEGMKALQSLGGDSSRIYIGAGQ